MSKLLLVEDDETIVENLCVFLQQEGFFVESVFGQKQAIELLEEKNYDLVLLDISLADGNGFAICSYIKQNTDIPVIFLTASGDEYSVVTGLDMGADDYITKPFNSREVVARIKAVLRRAGAQEKQEGRSRVEYDGLTIDMEEYQVVAFGQKMTFTAKEMELLWCLATNPGKAFSRNQLLETIWGYSYYGDTRTVDTHIKRIRQKLNIPENSKWDITTIWGVGYKFV